MRKAWMVAMALGLSMPALTTAAEAADFKLEQFFAGRSTATGSFKAINGVTRDFTVDLTGRWDGRTLVLREDFRFADGTKDRKTWRFTKTGDNRYTGTREDVVGETVVRVSGDTATFTYLVYLDSENQANLVRFHDQMKLLKDGTVINNALVTKFLVPVGVTRVLFKP